ncbi:MAG TPA: TonB-dependent receptor [Asticcacaulis sp.]|nr:TonB-dependent receptor [Asticcacaulis sp.]
MLNGGGVARQTIMARRPRLRMYTGLCGLMILSVSGGMAFAQTAPNAGKAPGAQAQAPQAPAKDAKPQDTKPQDSKSAAGAATNGGDTTTVTVTGQKAPNRIDRQSYDVSKDPDSQSGTAADALNKVPGVAVDPSGNVTLRGNNTQIMVNGRPSAMMSGDNRAAALQAMPSSMIASVEVISNPGAQFGSDSSGGSIINIVTRTALPAGGFASVNGRVNLNGGGLLGGNGNFHVGKWTLNGFATLNDTLSDRNSGSIYQNFNSAGNLQQITQSNTQSHTRNHSIFSNGSIEYAATQKDTLALQLTYTRSQNGSRGPSNNASYDMTGAATSVYSAVRDNDLAFETQSADLSWTRAGKRTGESLKVDAQFTRNLSNNASHSVTTYSLSSLPVSLGTRLQSNLNRSDTRTGIFSVDYNTSIGDDQIAAGVQVNHIDYSNEGEFFGPDPVGTTTPTLNALLSNQFAYSQTISAAYFTYQKRLGVHWTVLGGLRSEALDLDTEQLVTHAKTHTRYTRLNPSLFASYVLSDRARFRFNYSHRLTRPYPGLLNPSTRYLDDQNVAKGASNLVPQETNSFEGAYEYSYKGTNYQARAFYLKDDKVIVPVATFIPDPLHAGNQVLQTSMQNAGVREQTGIQLVYSGRIGKKWTIDANSNLSVIDFRTVNVAGAQSITSISGRLALGYTFANNDKFQFTYAPQGKQLTGQIYRSGYGTASLQYSHDIIKSKLKLVVAATDVLRSQKTTTVTRSPLVYSTSVSAAQAPIAYIALSYNLGSFGSAAPRPTTARAPIIVQQGPIGY